MSKRAISEVARALSALDQAVRQKYAPIPKGWFTSEEIAHFKQVCSDRGAHIARMMFENGIVDRQRWPQHPKPIFIYRLKVRP